MDHFDNLPPGPEAATTAIAPGAVLLPGVALGEVIALLQAVEAVLQQAPLRHMQTPGGFTMSLAMSNCGALGWVSDPSGYRYAALDPLSGQPWPAMPSCCLALAQRAAALAGYANFQPDACLINQYLPGPSSLCIKTGMSRICRRPSSRCRSVYRRCFCLAHPAAKTARSGIGWRMGMGWSGVGRRGWLFMA